MTKHEKNVEPEAEVEAGPDPIVEATKDLDQGDVRDQAQVAEDLKAEELEPITPEPEGKDLPPIPEKDKGA